MSKVLRHRLLGGRDEKVPELLTSSEKCARIGSCWVCRVFPPLSRIKKGDDLGVILRLSSKHQTREIRERRSARKIMGSNLWVGYASTEAKGWRRTTRTTPLAKC